MMNAFLVTNNFNSDDLWCNAFGYLNNNSDLLGLFIRANTEHKTDAGRNINAGLIPNSVNLLCHEIIVTLFPPFLQCVIVNCVYNGYFMRKLNFLIRKSLSKALTTILSLAHGHKRCELSSLISHNGRLIHLLISGSSCCFNVCFKVPVNVVESVNFLHEIKKLNECHQFEI
uniref:Uncharacterized protein n=1 Tax=Glossina austeni TaxID=7395 RepID=A0A1A9VM82_GLOAU